MKLKALIIGLLSIFLVSAAWSDVCSPKLAQFITEIEKLEQFDGGCLVGHSYQGLKDFNLRYGRAYIQLGSVGSEND